MSILKILCSLCVAGVIFSNCQNKKLTASDILNKSIAYHDPANKWSSIKTELHFDEIHMQDSIEVVRKTTVWLDNSKGYFKINRGGNEIHGMKMDSCFIEKGDFTCERAERLRNYYLYLWGLPMKLTDAGTQLSQEVLDTTWQNTPAYRLQVSYEKDDWSFYFDKKDFRLIGYSFVQNTGSGEDILLASEIEVMGMRIPKERSWYTLEGKFLGTDKLISRNEF